MFLSVEVYDEGALRKRGTDDGLPEYAIVHTCVSWTHIALSKIIAIQAEAYWPSGDDAEEVMGCRVITEGQVFHVPEVITDVYKKATGEQDPWGDQPDVQWLTNK